MNGRIGGVLNESMSGLWTPEEHLFDVNGIRTGVTPRYGSYAKPIICGVQDTGTRSTNGAGLRQVTAASLLQAATLDTAYFDEHPLFQFDEVIVNGNYFRSIPIAYWWRGNLPDTADGSTPRWTMLMSTAPGTVDIGGTSCEFTANPGAFKRNGSWLDRFLWGTYRAFNNSGAPGSQPGKTHWGTVSFTAFRDAAAGMGDGHHMGSLFEWQEILARAVIEKNTFQLVPEASRTNTALCKYRGIEHFAYGAIASNDDVRAEWMDGARIDSGGKYELWEEAGGVYISTGVTAFNGSGESTYYSQGLVTGANFDFLFIASTMGAASTSFIPDFSGRAGNNVSRICSSYFHASEASYGAFCSRFGYLPSNVHANIGSRLAKW